jgi:hypothetical protein
MIEAIETAEKMSEEYQEYEERMREWFEIFAFQPLRKIAAVRALLPREQSTD